MPAEVIALGAPLLDHIHFVPEEELFRFANEKGGMELLTEKELTLFENDPIIPGGSAINTLKGLRQLGCTALAIGKRGRDLSGERLERGLQEKGIETRLSLGSQPTGHVICYVTPDGERTMRTFQGASSELSQNDLDPTAFSGARLLHIEGYTLFCDQVTEQAMKMARQAGVRVSFDLSSFQVVETFKERIVSLLPFVDILFCNEYEAFALLGLPPQKACEALQKKISTAIVMQGIEGAYIGRQNEVLHIPSHPANPLDTTGAGDLFAAGVLFGLLKGYPLAEAGHLGSRAAHEVVKILGAELPQETWDELKLNSPFNQ